LLSLFGWQFWAMLHSVGKPRSAPGLGVGPAEKVVITMKIDRAKRAGSRWKAAGRCVVAKVAQHLAL
jgi:hypothetical protein